MSILVNKTDIKKTEIVEVNAKNFVVVDRKTGDNFSCSSFINAYAVSVFMECGIKDEEIIKYNLPIFKYHLMKNAREKVLN